MATAGDPGRRLEDILSCCLCFELYDNGSKIPKALPCQHTFCAECLDKLDAQVEGMGLKCPMCNATFMMPDTGASYLPTNFSMLDMMDLHRHEEKETTAQYRCEKHAAEPVVMVCTTCSVGLCTQCMKARGAHAQHELEDVKIYIEEFKTKSEEFEKWRAELANTIPKYRKDREYDIHKQYERTVNEIDLKADEAMKQVQDWGKSEKLHFAQKRDAFLKEETSTARHFENMLEQAKSIVSPKTKTLPPDISDAFKLLSEVDSGLRQAEKSELPVNQVISPFPRVNALPDQPIAQLGEASGRLSVVGQGEKEMIPVKKGVYRFIKQHMADDLEEIRTKHSISLRVLEQDGKWFVQYQGCAENVTAATASVQKLAKSPVYGAAICRKPGMATFFTRERSNGHRLVKSLETTHECTIEIRGEDRDASIAQAVTFHINARSENGLAAVKSELQAIVTDNYAEAEEHHACLEFAEDADLADLARILSHRSDTVIIEPDLDRKMVMIIARERVRGIMEEMKKKQEDPEYVKKHHGSTKFLHAMLNDKAQERLPPHWTKHTGMFSKLLSKFVPSVRNVLVDVDERTRAVIDQLVQGTWRPGRVGLGLDSVGLSHSKIHVKRVQRIENPKVYRRYRTQLSLACEEALKYVFPPVTDLDDHSEILTAALAIPELEAIRTRELNEYFLFHGIKRELVEHIVVQGPETRLSSSTGLFGSGLYLSESSTKADQYADDKRQRCGTGTDLYMVVFRVILGHIHHQQGSAKYKRPPCRHSGCHKDTCAHPHHFDSVLGTEKDGGVRLNFREFVLFENNRAYPEFLATYVRL